MVRSSIADSLAAYAAALGVRPNDVDVLVAHQRAFDAAAMLGMSPQFVEERLPAARRGRKRRKQTPPVPKGAILTHVPISQPAEVFA